MSNRSLGSIVVDLAIFLAAAGGTYLAQSLDRPITAVLTFLTGVILIAVHSGLTRALVAAIGASFVYNFLLSAPAFRFGVTSADEAVPLIAFNITALVTGIVVGRLRDFASRAYVAQLETAFLLTISDRLQRAIKVGEIEAAIRGMLPTQGVKAVELFLARGDTYVRPSTGETEIDHLAPLMEEPGDRAGARRSIILDLQGARGSLGIVRFRLADNADDRAGLPNLQSVSALLALAVERCLLLDEVADAQAHARSETLKDAILSSVSHDLRTPVTVIEAAAGTLASSRISLPEGERAGLLSSIIDQCRRLDRYTSELLDVGRIQAGISRADLEAVDLVEVVQLAITHSRTAAPATRVDRQLPRHPVFVKANAAMLEQAVFNVIENAQKFGGEGSPVVVSVKTEGDLAIVSIADLGPGISEQERGRIFRRFAKADKAVGRAGLGLGLFITKGFVDAFSGAIEIESPCVEDRGARISMRFPLAPAPMRDEGTQAA